jgi:hypothetical protein
MQKVYCDVCGKVVDQSFTERTFFYRGPIAVCEDCKDQLELTLKPIVRTKNPFSYEWFDRLIADSLEKAVQKGKFQGI